MDLALQYNAVNTALARAGYARGAAAFHGALCGALCREPAAQLDPLSLLDDVDDIDEPTATVLSLLRDETADAFNDLESGFAPLLPDDDVDLRDRAHALGAWCEGFLYGLASRQKLDLAAGSDELREVVEDLSQFTRASLDAGGANDAAYEIEETAYIELVEYIRIGVQVVYLEFQPKPHALSATSNALH